MKFYGRELELSKIEGYLEQIKTNKAELVVIIGRRRIGKTRLALEAIKNKPNLYFFVTRKKEEDLLRDWSAEIRRKFDNVFFGELQKVEDLLQFLFEYANNNPLAVVFDEFQNFFFNSIHVYSVFQKYYDQYRHQSSLLLIISGSSHSLMENIFKGAKEPLFGRATEIIHLSYLSLKAQSDFANDEGIISQKEKLEIFAVFDGVPKYMEEIAVYKGRMFSSRLKKILLDKDWLWEEGENILKEEFGKEYVSYFSILSSIAKGRRILSDIEQFSGIKEASSYLKKLEENYQMIERKVPVTVNNRSISRKGRYYLRDNFFAFWFRFIEPKRHLKEIGQKELAVREILEEMTQFTGRKLEDMVIRYIVEENPLHLEFTCIGSYWDRKGEIEIDIVILNERTKEAYLFEVKRDKKKINSKLMERMRLKAASISEIEDYRKHFGVAYPDNGNLKVELED